MRKVLLALSFIIVWVNCIAQTRSATPGTVPRANQSFVVEDGSSSSRNNLLVPRFEDSTEANTFTLLDTLGRIAFLYSSNSLWVRVDDGTGGKKWSEIGSGGGGGGFFTSSTGSANTAQNAGGFNYEINNLNEFLIKAPSNVIRLQIDGSSASLYSAETNALIGVSDGRVDLVGEVYADNLGGNGSGFVAVDNDGHLTWSAGGGGSGTVTTVSVVSANGFAGSVANATTTPAITLSTTITGILKGNGTAISAAVSGTDYLPITGGTSVTTLGTIATGTWNGTAISTTYGGTGLTSLGTSLQQLRVNVDGTALEYFTPDDPNLIVQNNSGSGVNSWYDSGDTLYIKRHKNTSTVSWSTDTDSSLLATVVDASITYAKIQNVTQARLLGRYTASTGVVQEITIGSGLSLNSSTGELTASGGGGSGLFPTSGTGTATGNVVGALAGNSLTISGGTVNFGAAGASNGIITLSGSTSGTITIQPANAAGTYTLTLPTDDGTSNQVLTTDGSGVLSWATPAGGGNVSNSGTPVNNQLGVWVSSTSIEGDPNLTFSSSTLSIGVAGSATGVLTMSGATSGTVTLQPASAAGTYTLTLPTNDGDAGQVLQSNGSGVLSWASSSLGLTQAADYTLTSTTSLQKLFNANGTGELTVAGNTTYLFEAVFNVTSMSSTSGNLGFDIIGAGTATATSAAWMAVGKDATSFTTAATMSGVYSLNTAETGNIVTAAAGLGVQVRITGQIRINTGGTIIPSVNLTTAAAAVVETDSYFKLTPIGSGSITNW